ncbi:hypothetical protein REPUB_Repub03eG0158100 [Reevesia pubescens]
MLDRRCFDRGLKNNAGRGDRQAQAQDRGLVRFQEDQRCHLYCSQPHRGSNHRRYQGLPPSQPPLDWPTRKRIALGSVRGLSYLHNHCDPKIIHRDVKAANILLDEEFEAVVGDFSLAKLMDYKDTHVTTVVRGTI